MSDALRARQWHLIERVYQLRVRRARQMSHDAGVEAREAASDTARHAATLVHHEAARRGILDASAAKVRAASLWRDALRRHGNERVALAAELAAAREVEAGARTQVRTALLKLQREQNALDHARGHIKGLLAAHLDRVESDEQ